MKRHTLNYQVTIETRSDDPLTMIDLQKITMRAREIVIDSLLRRPTPFEIEAVGYPKSVIQDVCFQLEQLKEEEPQ